MRVSRYRIFELLVVVGATLLVGPRAAMAGHPVVLRHLDGMTQSGELIAVDATQVLLDTEESQQAVPLTDVARLEFSESVPVSPRRSVIKITLADGGLLFGALRDAEAGQLAIQTPFAEALHIPFSQLRAVRLGLTDASEAADLFAQALADPPAGQDTLIALSPDGPKALRGTLQTLGPEEGAFTFGGRERSFRTSKLFGIVLAKTPNSDAPGRVAVYLRGGEIITGDQVELRDDRLTFETTFGTRIDLSVEQVMMLRWRSDRVVSLSGFKSEAQSSTGIVHPTWAIRREHNVLNEPIMLDGKHYPDGIGMHAPASVDFSLGGKYAIFAADIGIDDAVGSGGSARFIVLGDGQQLFESEVLTGADTAQPIRVDVNGVTTLTLRVDSATNVDIGDWADWADARIILPRETP